MSVPFPASVKGNFGSTQNGGLSTDYSQGGKEVSSFSVVTSNIVNNQFSTKGD